MLYVVFNERGDLVPATAPPDSRSAEAAEYVRENKTYPGGKCEFEDDQADD